MLYHVISYYIMLYPLHKAELTRCGSTSPSLAIFRPFASFLQRFHEAQQQVVLCVALALAVQRQPWWTGWGFPARHGGTSMAGGFLLGSMNISEMDDIKGYPCGLENLHTCTKNVHGTRKHRKSYPIMISTEQNATK